MVEVQRYLERGRKNDVGGKERKKWKVDIRNGKGKRMRENIREKVPLVISREIDQEHRCIKSRRERKVRRKREVG